MNNSDSLNKKVSEELGIYLAKTGRRWQLQDAKARFSELFRLTHSGGPQIITRQGTDAVVMIPLSIFDKLVENRKSENIAQFFSQSPLAAVELDLKRNKDIGRQIGI